MKQRSFLRCPKKEEQQLVPEKFEGIGNLEEIKGFLGINNFDAKVEEEKEQHHEILVNNTNNFYGEHEIFGWDFSNWENEDILFPNHQEIRDQSFNINDFDGNVKKEEEDCGSFCGFWDENVMEETKTSLNLNLNYEEVLEAWSNRGSLWAHNHHPSLSMSSNHYMGEVPNLEEERTRRETSVLRYKEKRRSRLFSKKIRYEVRKLNADKRPRLKGRFVKRISDDNYDKMSR
ncbi:hypothetical protein BVRB_7g175170 [Beta vulgaris subsp. vulgaris]|nr:hypothetical protein BVRB_7g175170 [Beta vulgaris subsp. vulgaris]